MCYILDTFIDRNCTNVLKSPGSYYVRLTLEYMLIGSGSNDQLCEKKLKWKEFFFKSNNGRFLKTKP